MWIMRAFNCISKWMTGNTTTLSPSPVSAPSWWRHQMETFSALLAICAGNSPVPDEFPAQRPVTRSFDVFYDLRLNKRLSKQSWGWWFETLSHPLWRHCNAAMLFYKLRFHDPVTMDLMFIQRRSRRRMSWLVKISISDNFLWVHLKM